MDGGMAPEIWLKLTSSVRRLDNTPMPSGIRPEMRFLLTAKKRRLEQEARESGSSPWTRPGTSESSVSADIRPSAGSSLPVSPGDPALGSPSASADTLFPSQYTPGKPQGSAVKSQASKKAEPGMSSSDLRTACSARKSTGSRMPSAASAAAKNTTTTAPSRAIPRKHLGSRARRLAMEWKAFCKKEELKAPINLVAGERACGVGIFKVARRPPLL